MPKLNEIATLSSKLAFANTMYERYQSNSLFGKNLNSKLYDALGFPANITYRDYVDKYRRQDVANRIVNAPVDGSWSKAPAVYETTTSETQFEKDFKAIEQELDLFSNLHDLDVLATLGRYSILYLGLNDGVDPSIPATRASMINYVTPIPEDRAEIQTWDNESTSPRYGAPLSYTITINADAAPSISQTVHYSRIIHVAENTLDNKVYGIPALEPVFNRLLGLEKLAGGSPEMYWRGARPGYVAQSSENMIITDSQVASLKTELDKFVNKMDRFIYAEGVDIQPLAQQVVSPTDHIDCQLKLICAATQIPLRILTGSERGELASSQDALGWLTYLETRRVAVAEKLILRPAIDKFIELGLISAPVGDEYTVAWEPLVVTSEKEKAEIALIHMQAIKTWGESIGGQDIYPPEFLLKQLGKSDEEIELQLAVSDEEVALEEPIATDDATKEDEPMKE